MNPDLDTLERLIDLHGLPSVLEMLSSICGMKAEHLAVNWQDATGAKTWDRDSRELATLAAKLESGG